MPDKWTTASAMKEFKRRERDILDQHRMARDRMFAQSEMAADLPPDLIAQNNGEMPKEAGCY